MTPEKEHAPTGNGSVPERLAGGDANRKKDSSDAVARAPSLGRLWDSAAPEPRRLSARTIKPRELADPPVEEFVVGSLFPFRKASVLYAPQGAGKSAFLAQLAFTFAGLETDSLMTLFLSMPVHDCGNVLVYSAEDTYEDWVRKAAAYKHAFGSSEVERALQRVYIIDKSEGTARFTELVQLTAHDRVRSIQRREPQRTPEWTALRASALWYGAALIIIETTSRLVEDEDNANMAAFIGACGHLAAETGAAVVVSHHPTKAASQANDSNPEAARGGSALINNSRTAVSLFPATPEQCARWSEKFDPQQLLRLEHTKSTSSVPKQPDIILVRCPTPWGAVLRLPEEVATDASPGVATLRNAAVDRAQREKSERLQRVYDVVARAKAGGSPVSANKLTAYKDELGVGRNRVFVLVDEAIAERVVVVKGRDASGRILDLELGTRPGDSPGDSSSNVSRG